MRTIEEIMNGFKDYCLSHDGKEPNAIECSVCFYDDGSEIETIVKLNCGFEEKYDDEIFFYCDHFGELISLVGKNSRCEDFYINEVHDFINLKED